MKALKAPNARAWQLESDRANDERETRHLACERVRRTLDCSCVAAVQTRPLSDTNLPEQMAAVPKIPMTTHAMHRLKNRGITLEQVRIVTEFGMQQRSHGATRYALDKKSRQLVAEGLPSNFLRRAGSLDIVAVYSDDGVLITASHRTERLRRDVTKH